MNTIILPTAYRRVRHSVRRSSIMERSLPKLKNEDLVLNAKSGEVPALRISNGSQAARAMNTNNKAILAHSNNLSNGSVITV